MNNPIEITTEDVLAHFKHECPPGNGHEKLHELREPEFRDWLERQLEKAWDAGFAVGERSGAREIPLNNWTENPHRGGK